MLFAVAAAAASNIEGAIESASTIQQHQPAFFSFSFPFSRSLLLQLVAVYGFVSIYDRFYCKLKR